MQAANGLKGRNVKGWKVNGKERRSLQQNSVRKDKRRGLIQMKRRKLTENSPDLSFLPTCDLRIELQKMKETIQQGVSNPDLLNPTTAIVKELRLLLSSSSITPPMDLILELQLTPVLISYLTAVVPIRSSPEGEDACLETLWCLTNIATGSHEHTKSVLGAANLLVELISTTKAGSKSSEIAQHAAWTIGNIAADCDEFRKVLHDAGAIRPAIQMLEHPELPIVCTAAWTLSNLARGVDTSAYSFINQGILPPMFAQLELGDPAVVTEIAWVLSFLTAREDECVELLLQRNLGMFLVRYLSSSDVAIVTPILRVIGNLCSGKDQWIAQMLEQKDFLEQLYKILSSDLCSTALLKEGLWVVSNLASSDDSVTQILIQHGFLAVLGNAFGHSAFDVRRETAFALANIAQVPNQLPNVIELDIIDGFIQMLSVSDAIMVRTALRFIENVLRNTEKGVELVETHDGIEYLENLQYSDVSKSSEWENLSSWAQELVDKFYGESYGAEEVETEVFNFAPPTNSAGRGRSMTKPAWMTNNPS